MSKSLLIIGATGFFGRSIVDYIFYNNKKTNINKLLLLSRSSSKIKFNKKLNKKIKIKTICADISKLKKIPFADYVIYCAIDHNYNRDYQAVCNYYKLAKKYHLKSKILYTSSGAVYGQQPINVKKINENYLLNNKRIDFKNYNKNIYSKTKLKNEEIFKKLAKFKIKVSIARCFAFIGKNLPKNRNYVAGNLINNILNSEKIKIKADHHVIRSYMHEYDLVVWLLNIVKNASTDCPIYNVGSDQEINIRKLAIYLSSKYKLSTKLKKIRSSFIDRYLPSILKAKKDLNLELKYNTIDSINEVINRLRNNLLVFEKKINFF
jgi:nucleoside-diphosphate-sugar epimerase